MSASIFLAELRFWKSGSLFRCFDLLLSQVKVGINRHAHYSCESTTYTSFAGISIEQIVVPKKNDARFELSEYDMADSRGSPVELKKLKFKSRSYIPQSTEIWGHQASILKSYHFRIKMNCKRQLSNASN